MLCMKNGLAYQWLFFVSLFQEREDVVVLLLTRTVDTPDIDHWCDFRCGTPKLFDVMRPMCYVLISNQSFE